MLDYRAYSFVCYFRSDHLFISLYADTFHEIDVDFYLHRNTGTYNYLFS